MKYIQIIMIAVGIMTILLGCSVFMPYKEDFICNVPEGKGYCGSLSDGYEYSINYNNY